MLVTTHILQTGASGPPPTTDWCVLLGEATVGDRPVARGRTDAMTLPADRSMRRAARDRLQPLAVPGSAGC
jgi:hypothetical protein